MVRQSYPKQRHSQDDRGDGDLQWESLRHCGGCFWGRLPALAKHIIGKPRTANSLLLYESGNVLVSERKSPRILFSVGGLRPRTAQPKQRNPSISPTKSFSPNSPSIICPLSEVHVSSQRTKESLVVSSFFFAHLPESRLSLVLCLTRKYVNKNKKSARQILLLHACGIREARDRPKEGSCSRTNKGAMGRLEDEEHYRESIVQPLV